MTNDAVKVRVIACGAIAREILVLCQANRLEHIELTCLPAQLHNTPDKIPGEVEQKILEAGKSGIDHIFIAYADCGTSGLLDKICERYGVERISGPHCYSFFRGNDHFSAESERHMRSFFLTDFLVRQFNAFVVKPLGLDRHPELRDMYFGNYEKLVYLVQNEDPKLDEMARQAANFLDLAYERQVTGYGDLGPVLERINAVGHS